MQCIGCGAEYPVNKIIYNCERCGDLLEVRVDERVLKEKIEMGEWRLRPISVWKYKEFLPVFDETKIVTLREGVHRYTAVIGLAKSWG